MSCISSLSHRTSHQDQHPLAHQNSFWLMILLEDSQLQNHPLELCLRQHQSLNLKGVAPCHIGMLRVSNHLHRALLLTGNLCQVSSHCSHDRKITQWCNFITCDVLGYTPHIIGKELFRQARLVLLWCLFDTSKPLLLTLLGTYSL